MLLAVDTSTRVASVALWEDDHVLAELTWQAGQDQTSELYPGIQTLLTTAGVSLDQVDAVAVAKGPGSFNGVRVGISAAKGLALARGWPLIGVPTLEVQAYPFAACRKAIVSVLPAGRGEYAVAKYQMRQGSWRSLAAEQIVNFAGLHRLIGRGAIVTGEIPLELARDLREALGGAAMIVPSSASLRRGGPLAQLAQERLARGESDDVNTLQPIYLRRPPITQRKAS